MCSRPLTYHNTITHHSDCNFFSSFLKLDLMKNVEVETELRVKAEPSAGGLFLRDGATLSHYLKLVL